MADNIAGIITVTAQHPKPSKSLPSQQPPPCLLGIIWCMSGVCPSYAVHVGIILPMIETQDLKRLRHIGWRDRHLPDPGLYLARVVARHRAAYQLHDGKKVFGAQFAQSFSKRDSEVFKYPVVGDFVEVKPGRPAQIMRVLPRRSALWRAQPGARHAHQLMVTNIDVALILTGLDGDFNPARIERYLSLTDHAGTQAVVVLGKRDLCKNVEDLIAQLRERLPAQVPIHAINSKDPVSARVLADYLKPGRSAVLLSSSGAGKSTLTNTLLGVDTMPTAAVRQHDSRGRHTTVQRALKLTGEENLTLFADIDNLAMQCRFANCKHDNEPGCRIRTALSTGALSLARWQHYLKLHRERQGQAGILNRQHKRAGWHPGSARKARDRNEPD